MDFINILTITISLLALLVTYAVFKSNQQPRIIVFATPHYGKETFIQLHIKNIGNSIAENVEIKADRKIPRQAFGISNLNGNKQFFDNGIFNYGIKNFIPNQSYIYDWGQFGGLKETLNNQPITFYVTYEYKHPLNLWKSKIQDTSIINIQELEALPSSTGNSTEQLRKIGNELAKLTNKISK